MTILLIQTAFIGDVILATALIESLKNKYPECRIDFLLRKGNESLLQDHPLIENVLIFDKEKEKYKNLLKILRIIRRKKYDVVINVQRFFTTGMITVLSGAKTKIGFDKNPLSYFFTKTIKHEISEKGKIVHEIERNLKLLGPLFKPELANPKLYPSTDEKKIIPDEKYICLAPGSIWKTKQWPVEKWIELSNNIPVFYNIYLIGSKNDIDICNMIITISANKNITSLAGKLSLLQSAALITGASMTYTNDSAPMHLASAMNAPVSAIFCSTIPQFGFGPVSDKSYIFETQHKLSCRPCNLHGKKECPEGHFMCGDIDVKEVIRPIN